MIELGGESFQQNLSKLNLGEEFDQGFIATKPCSYWMSGYHRVVGKV